MRKALEDLYYGNITPHEKRIPAKSELQRMVSRAAECENRLTKLLNDEGKELTVEEIGAPNLLASAFIFATENRFPVNVEAIGPCEVFVIGKERFLEFMRLHPLMMQNFLKDISDRSVFLSRKLNEFALLNLKTRLLKYLETHSVIHNQQEVAQKLGVTRPSLARALSELVNEGKIKK